ncbi:MAG: YbdD/YjiX family protein [Gemmatimonadota bacterium]
MTSIRNLLQVVRRIAGMPDYERYVEHLRSCHPEQSIPGRREYYERYLDSRYGSGTSRCC